MAAERLILIDGSAYIFRAFHALPPMTRSDGTPVNAVFGFTSMVLKLIDDLAPDHAIIILDAARATFRNEIYPEYKANRGAPPEELVPQFPLFREAAVAMNLPVAEEAGFEADDLIASYARAATAEGMEVVIISSDKDLMQLIRPGVTMLDPMKQTRIGPDEVVARFGAGPDKVVDIQALAGDSTDNVPGVPGIGIKTAAELINQYGDLDTLLARATEIKQPKRRQNLLEYAEMARLSRQLVRLREDAPMPVSLADASCRPYEPETLLAFLRQQEFSRLISRVSQQHAASGTGSAAASSAAASSGQLGNATADSSILSSTTTADYSLVRDAETLARWVNAARDAGFVAIDTETTSLKASEALVVGVSLAVAPDLSSAGHACYIPLRHQKPAGDAAAAQGGFDFGDEAIQQTAAELVEGQLDFDTTMAQLKPLLEDPSVLKIGHNLKYDWLVLQRPVNGGIRMTPVDDTMCLSFVLDAGRVANHKLDTLAMIHCDHATISYEQVCGKGASQVPFSAISPEAALDYAAEDADITLRLWHVLKPRLHKEGRTAVYERLERPLIPVLATMEAAGISVSQPVLERLGGDFAKGMTSLGEIIHNLAGVPFNIASPKQLGEVLFDQMGLEGGKKSKTGAYSTSAEVLDNLAAQGVEIAEKVLEWRQLAKLKSTYTDALSQAINPETGRVHTSFSMVGASTGRLSSSDPNIQNIPIRTAEGRQIRTAFIAAPGKRLISADYSQIELRLVAHIAAEASMIEAFRNGVDIHAQTASEVFGVPLQDMTAETRRRAKAINFGIIYGISAFGLGRQLGVAQSEAKSYIEAYFDRFPGIRAYMNDTRNQAREDGFVATLFGRRLTIQGITASNPAQRGFAERQAINAPIQGTAADIIKQAMVRLPAALEAAGLPARMLLQVHDELIIEAEDSCVDAAISTIIRVMEQAASPQLELAVPLVVEARAGSNWDEAH